MSNGWRNKDEPLPRAGGGAGLLRCEHGHFYDSAKFSHCPYDGVSSIEFGSPASIPIGPPGDQWHAAAVGDQPTMRIGQGEAPEGVDPVVGWLVCVHGLSKGQDYRIHSENNTVGRSENMDICISKDDLISRERHTVITFDPQNNRFYLGPGEAQSVVYLNGEAVLEHKELEPYDEILLGATKLLFVPLCGDKFKWS